MQPVPIQPKEKRIHNFNEVSLGYSKKIALEEARRCPQSSREERFPHCPLGIDVLTFIRYLREDNPQKALELIRQENSFPAVCGRLCSAPCENDDNFAGASMGIRALERYASDHGRQRFKKFRAEHPLGAKVAVVGSGPSGLMASAELAKLGYQVTVFESFENPGGILRYGIPEFRMPQNILDTEIDYLESLGVQIETNAFLGQTISLEEVLKKGYQSVLLAIGSGTAKSLDIPGTNLGGVFYGEEFLMRARQSLEIGPRVLIIGAGNTALDCARTAVRLKHKSTIVVRGTEDDIGSRAQEIEYAKEEGVQFETLVSPVEIVSGRSKEHHAAQNHCVSGLKCRRLDFAETKGQGKQWKLKIVPDSEFMIEADTVIIAVGHRPNAFLNQLAPDIKQNKDGTLRIDKYAMTSIKNIFACGNIVTGPGSLIGAMASGKTAARRMHEYITKNLSE